LIPTGTAVDVCILVSQGTGRGDAGWKQMWTSHEWGDHERWRGPFFFLFVSFFSFCFLFFSFFFFFFFFFYVMYSLLKYKKPRGALAMA